MTKDKVSLKWRLSGLPTADEINRLVQNTVISKEEARAILFNEQTEEKIESSQKIKELKRQIDFLQEVIENLSKGNRTTITYTPSLPNYTPYWKLSPTITWSSTSGKTGGYITDDGWMNTTATYSVNTGNLIS